MIRKLFLCAILSLVSISSFAQSRSWVSRKAKTPSTAIAAQPAAPPAVSVSSTQAPEELVPANWVKADKKERGDFNGHTMARNGRPVNHRYISLVLEPTASGLKTIKKVEMMCVMPRVCLKNLKPDGGDTDCETDCYTAVKPSGYTTEEFYGPVNEFDDRNQSFQPKAQRIFTEAGKLFLIVTVPVRGPVMKESPPPPNEYACAIEPAPIKATTRVSFEGRTLNVDFNNCYGKPTNSDFVR